MDYKNQFKIMVCCFFLSVNAEAQVKSPFQHDFTLGVESMKYFYKEPDIYQDNDPDGAVWMDDMGYLFGINGSYRLTWKEMLFVQPEGRIVYGKHDYRTGIKEKVNLTTKKEILTFLYETRLLLGGKSPLINNLTLSPYTGLGYRFKSDDSEKVKCNDGDVLGYYRKSNYIYVPFGTYIDYTINDTWSISLKGEYDWMMKGWHYTRSLTSIPRTYKQPNGYGLKGEFSVSYLYNKVKFSVSPYINYWNIRNSKRSQDGGREPYNVTFESGMRFGMAF